MAKGLGGGGAGVAAPAPKPGGFFGAPGNPGRTRMVEALLTAGMQAAGGSDSPALAFLTPIMGAMIGQRASTLADTYDADQRKRANTAAMAMIGGQGSIEQYLDLLGDPTTPDHVRNIASTMLATAMKPAGGGGRGGGGGSRKTREDQNGVLRYLDTGEEVFPGVVTNPAVNPRDYDDILKAYEHVNQRRSDLELTMTPEEAEEAMRGDPYITPLLDLLAPGGGAPVAPPPGPSMPPPPATDGWTEVAPGVRIREIQ